jgi:hypothetical protein
MNSVHDTDAFDTSHHAASLRQKMVRALQLGSRYYLLDLPRYFSHRRALGHRPCDSGAWVSPLREFFPRLRRGWPAPPHLREALGLCAEAGVRLTIPPHRLAGLVGAWWQARGVPGDVLECGAYRGATSLLLAVLARLNGVNKATIMLDTFSGIPHAGPFDPSRGVGEFRPDAYQEAVIRSQAATLGVADRVKVRAGLFDHTLPALRSRPGFRLAFLHIDANTFSGTLAACELAIPVVSAGGVVCFDDYHGVCDLGARLAIDYYLSSRGVRPRLLTGSSAFLHVPPGGLG